MEEYERIPRELIEEHASIMFSKSTRCCYIGYDGANYFDNPQEMLIEFRKAEREHILKCEMEWEAIRNYRWWHPIVNRIKNKFKANKQNCWLFFVYINQ